MEQFWQREEENVKLWILAEVNQFVHSLFARLRAKYENGFTNLSGHQASLLRANSQTHLQDLAGVALQVAQFGAQSHPPTAPSTAFDASLFAVTNTNQSQQLQQQPSTQQNHANSSAGRPNGGGGSNANAYVDVEFDSNGVECDCSVFEDATMKTGGNHNTLLSNNNGQGQAILSSRRPSESSNKRSTSNHSRSTISVPAHVPASKQSSSNEVVQTECLKCPNCVYWFPNKDQLDQHMLAAHKVEKFRCAQNGCGHSYASSKMLGAHLRVAHSNTKWACGLCSTTNEYKDHKSLQTHMLNHHYLGNFKCAFPNCDQTANHRAAIRQHYVSAHRNFACVSAGCQQIFNNSASLKSHEDNVHRNNKKRQRCGSTSEQAEIKQRQHNRSKN